MSKRFVLHASQSEVERYFSVEADPGFKITSNYNISAGALHPLILKDEGQSQVIQAKWGLLPPDAENEREGKENCIIPVEDLQEDDWLHECIEKRRALVPASGFYKWKSTENKTTPFYVRMLSGTIMALGGIYRRWKSSSGREVYSFAILTTEANALIEPVADRMPVIVRPENFEKWLNENVEAEEIFGQIEDYPTMLTEMIVNRVSEEVNDINNNGPELIQPIPK